MTRKSRRLTAVLACGLGLGTAAALSLMAFRDTMVFFLAPSDIGTKAGPGRTFRLGGLVEAGSVVRASEGGKPTARFRVTDGQASVEVTYTGILPDLFREGQGIVSLGSIAPDGTFRAEDVLAKHDETYMPKEVADALKKSGRWKPEDGAPPSAATWNTMNTSKATDAKTAVLKVGG